MKKTLGWGLVVGGFLGYGVAALALSGPTEQAVGFAVLLAPLVGLYLLVDAHLRLEDGNVLRSFRGLRLRR